MDLQFCCVALALKYRFSDVTRLPWFGRMKGILTVSALLLAEHLPVFFILHPVFFMVLFINRSHTSYLLNFLKGTKQLRTV